jgi:hypothetical protein
MARHKKVPAGSPVALLLVSIVALEGAIAKKKKKSRGGKETRTV